MNRLWIPEKTMHANTGFGGTKEALTNQLIIEAGAAATTPNQFTEKIRNGTTESTATKMHY